MKTDNPIQTKSYSFALRMIKLYQHLHDKKKEFILSKQVLRAGTSIGANVEEAIGAQSDKDFFTKITIAYKEARETYYWLRLLRDSEYLSAQQAESILKDAEELIKLLASIKSSMAKKINLS